MERRLIWEEALLTHLPELAGAWVQTMAAHAIPLEASAEEVALAILQEAADEELHRQVVDPLGIMPVGVPQQ